MIRRVVAILLAVAIIAALADGRRFLRGFNEVRQQLSAWLADGPADPANPSQPAAAPAADPIAQLLKAAKALVGDGQPKSAPEAPEGAPAPTTPPAALPPAALPPAAAPIVQPETSLAERRRQVDEALASMAKETQRVEAEIQRLRQEATPDEVALWALDARLAVLREFTARMQSLRDRLQTAPPQ